MVNRNAGRDHWPRLSTLALAGGGLRMGQVIGQSTARADAPRSDPVTVENLLATLMHVLLGSQRVPLPRDLPRAVATTIAQARPIAALI